MNTTARSEAPTAAQLIARSYVQIHLRPVDRIHPRIVLLHCEHCGGTGKYRWVSAGQWREFACTQCSGRGKVCVES